MAKKDYKNAVNPDTAPPAKKPFPGWAWLITGMLVGLFVAFLWYLQQLPSDEKPTGIQQMVKKELEKIEEKVEKTVDEVKEESLSSRFDFYKLLPDMEVVVPDPLLEKEIPSEAEKGKEQQYNYFLQAASFRNFKDADRMKAMLAFEGIEATIQKVTNKEGVTWHRVRIGPFQSRRKLDVIRSRLQKGGVQPVVIKEKV